MTAAGITGIAFVSLMIAALVVSYRMQGPRR